MTRPHDRSVSLPPAGLMNAHIFCVSTTLMASALIRPSGTFSHGPRATGEGHQ